MAKIHRGDTYSCTQATFSIFNEHCDIQSESRIVVISCLCGKIDWSLQGNLRNPLDDGDPGKWTDSTPTSIILYTWD